MRSKIRLIFIYEVFKFRSSIGTTCKLHFQELNSNKYKYKYKFIYFASHTTNKATSNCKFPLRVNETDKHK